jgi:hypothetical protein
MSLTLSQNIGKGKIYRYDLLVYVMRLAYDTAGCVLLRRPSH